MNARITSFVFLAGCLLVIPRVRAQYPWPVKPLHQTHTITGVFGEYRDTGSSPHFHNGTDIPKADGSPVYAITDARVTSLTRSGPNAYIRAGRFAYVHTNPSPDLAVGDSVFAQETVVGTVLSGQGHVHLNDGPPGNLTNALLPGHLAPYKDPWPPAISIPRFYVKETRQRLGSSELAGRVEITFRVQERNAPPRAASNRRNNGSYEVGYEVLTRDRDSVVYAPAGDGVVFRFNHVPDDDYVHNVYDPLQSSTSRHVYIPTNRPRSQGAFNTKNVPVGDYTIRLFSRDTRGNVGEKFVDVTISHEDRVPPRAPTLLEAGLAGRRVTSRWGRPPSRDLEGYRLYRAATPTGDFDLAQAEGVLKPDSTRYRFPDALTEPAYFYVTATDTAQNVSTQSDVYGAAPAENGLRVLVVDGFDRTSGSWQTPWHRFAARHGEALAARGIGFTTVANEAVTRDDVDLDDYDAVVWGLGDESTDSETFSTAEQIRVKAFLRNGGKLFVSGSEMAWDLDRQGSSGDAFFFAKYLKASFAYDNAGSTTAKGTDAGLFAGLSFSYGRTPYREDYPDAYEPERGGKVALRYGNDRVAAVQYAGPFDTGDTSGKLVVMGFPFETIGSAADREAVMGAVMQFFFPEALPAEGTPGEEPGRLVALPNYPDPVRAYTIIPFSLPAPGTVTFTVFDALGRRVVVHHEHYGAGAQKWRWQVPPQLASGAYFYRVEAGRDVEHGAVTVAR